MHIREDEHAGRIGKSKYVWAVAQSGSPSRGVGSVHASVQER